MAQLGLVRLESLWGAATPSPAALATLGAAAAAVVAELADDERQAAHVNRVLNRAESPPGADPDHAAGHPLRPAAARVPRPARPARRGAAPRHTRADPGPVGLCGRIGRDRERLGPGETAPARPGQRAPRSSPSRPRSASGGGCRSQPCRPPPRSPSGPATTWTTTAGPTRRSTTRRPASTTRTSPQRCGSSSSRHWPVGTRPNAPSRPPWQPRPRVTTAPLTGRWRIPSGTVWLMEGLLPRVVLPMARKAPVLLLVMDGMSAAAATEILDDATERLDWVEAALAGSHAPVRRPVGPAVADRGQPGVAAVRPADPRAAGRRTGRVCRAHHQLGEDQGKAVPQEGRRHDRPRRAGRRRRRRGPRRHGRIPARHDRPEHHRRRPGPQRRSRHALDGRRGQAPRAAAGPGSRPPAGPSSSPPTTATSSSGEPAPNAAIPVSPAVARARRPERSGRTRSRSTAGGSSTSTDAPCSPSAKACATAR